jgi:hypothetical protein
LPLLFWLLLRITPDIITPLRHYADWYAITLLFSHYIIIITPLLLIYW